MIAIAAAALIAVVSVIFLLKQVTEAAHCRRKLLSLYSNIHIHTTRHAGHHAADIIAVATCRNSALLGVEMTHARSNYWISVLLTCKPGAKRSLTTTNAALESDYIYINWEQFFGTNYPPNYPLMYDRHMRNHWGMGVNVLTTDGRRFWDYRVRWLRDFAQKHPEYELLLPD